MPLVGDKNMRYTHDYDMLPERAFQKKLFSNAPATLEGGKGGGGGAPSADPAIGRAQERMATLSEKQYEDFTTKIWPALEKQTQTQLDMSNKVQQQQYDITKKQDALGDEQLARFKKFGYPLQEQIFKDAETAGSKEEQEQQASSALSDVKSQFAAAKGNTARNMQSYGIDPTSGAYRGQENANQIMEAATGSAAATRARNAAIQLGWAKKMDASALAQGQYGNQATATGLSLNAGNSALASGAAGTNAINAQGNSYVQGTGAAMGGWNQIGQLGNQKYATDVSAYNASQQASATSSAGIGAAVGAIGGAALKYAPALMAMSDIRTKENIEFVGHASNGLPIFDFEYKPEFKDSKYAGHGRFRGFMVHDIEKLIPEAVFKTEDGYKAVDYSKVV
jgi:hypothetical protein